MFRHNIVDRIRLFLHVPPVTQVPKPAAKVAAQVTGNEVGKAADKTAGTTSWTRRMRVSRSGKGLGDVPGAFTPLTQSALQELQTRMLVSVSKEKAGLQRHIDGLRSVLANEVSKNLDLQSQMEALQIALRIVVETFEDRQRDAALEAITELTKKYEEDEQFKWARFLRRVVMPFLS